MKLTFAIETVDDAQEAVSILTKLYDIGLSEPLQAETPDLDSAGLPWDDRIHASSKALNADGTWRAKRGVSADLVKTVEAELSPPPVELDPTPPAPPPPPPQEEPDADGAASFMDVMKLVTGWQKDGKDPIETLRAAGVLADSEGVKDLIPPTAQEKRNAAVTVLA